MRDDRGSDVLPTDAEVRLSEAEARWVLARAAEHERVWNAGVPAARLREAAVEAGISAAAFDRAVAEVRRGPARPGRRWGGGLAAVLALVLVFVLGAGIVAVRGRPLPARPGAAALPTTVQPVVGDQAASVCTFPDGVSGERLRALAGNLYPEVSAPRNRHRALVVALLFDAGCNLKAHVLTRRATGDQTLEEVLGPVFPVVARGASALQAAGGADVGPWTFERGAPKIMWAMERPPE